MTISQSSGETSAPIMHLGYSVHHESLKLCSRDSLSSMQYRAAFGPFNDVPICLSTPISEPQKRLSVNEVSSCLPEQIWNGKENSGSILSGNSFHGKQQSFHYLRVGGRVPVKSARCQGKIYFVNCIATLLESNNFHLYFCSFQTSMKTKALPHSSKEQDERS